MVARIVKSTNGRNGQYVGTIRNAPPSPELGSPTARQFNGTTDRIIGPRSNDLGQNYAMVLTFWRGTTADAENDLVSQRLFSQYCLGGTRVAVGINRSFLSLGYTQSSGLFVTRESRIRLTNTQRHRILLLVTSSEIVVWMDRREIFRETATLALPDSARLNFGSDANSRFFNGWIDDIALYQKPPSNVAYWLNYYMQMAENLPVRDKQYAAFAEGFNSVLITQQGRVATGGLPSSRVKLDTPWRTEPELTTQHIEYMLTPVVDPSTIRIGVVLPSHDLTTINLGDSSASYGWTQNGTCRQGGAIIAQGLPEWTAEDRMGFGWTPETRQLVVYKNGVSIHNVTLPVGVWTPAINIGANSARINAGQEPPYDLPLSAPGLPSRVWSQMTSEFRHAKLGEVAAPLDDDGQYLFDAYTNTAAGNYMGTPETDEGITSDSFDVSRKVSSGIVIPAADHTTADDDFFFILAVQPDAADLTGEHVILESPGNWGLRLVDGNLNAWVGAVQVGTSTPPLEVGESYLLGLSRSPAGRLLVWSSVGYVMQSGDPTTAQPEGPVWVGSGADGERAWQGRISHLVLSSKRIDQWKLDRLRQAADWAVPGIAGAIPNPTTLRRVYEVNWRDVQRLGLGGTANSNFVAAIAAAPDELAVEYRMVQRVGAGGFVGTDIHNWTPHGLLPATTGLGTISVTLADFTDLDDVAVGQAALISDEIVRVDMINHLTGEVILARACADTVPVKHPAGTVVWFYEADEAVNTTSRLINTEVEVKILTRNALTELEEGMAPSDFLTTSGRLARPYPPAGVTINEESDPAALSGVIYVQWKHRNKTSQGNGLVSWDEASVTPPTGLTYQVRAYNTSTGVLIHESSVLPRTVNDYDLYVEGYEGPVTVEVISWDGTLSCLQPVRMQFEYVAEVEAFMLMQDGVTPVRLENDTGNVGLERMSRLRATSFSGDLPDDFNVMAMPLAAPDDWAGVPISDFPPIDDLPQPQDLFPIVVGQENRRMSLQQLVDWLGANVSLPQDGQSAYELAGGDAEWGSLANWQASLIGPAGPASNSSRRIQTINSGTGAIVCNWALYDEIRIRLVGNVTLTFQGAKDGQGCMLKFQQDNVGGRLVELPPSVRFNNLVQTYHPTPNAGLVDKIGFVYDNAQSTYDLVSIVPGIANYGG